MDQESTSNLEEELRSLRSQVRRLRQQMQRSNLAFSILLLAVSSKVSGFLPALIALVTGIAGLIYVAVMCLKDRRDSLPKPPRYLVTPSSSSAEAIKL